MNRERYFVAAAGVVIACLPGCTEQDDSRGLINAQSLGARLAANSPPAAPVILEPEVGRIFHPGNVHMETEPFSDPDPGDRHSCTDWELWTVAPAARVWSTPCIPEPLLLHTHLGDGIFEGSHLRRRTLFPETDYLFRVRHRDSSGLVANDWSPWSERPFQTGALTQIFPMLLSDVLSQPLPSLRIATGGTLFALPGGAVPATVRVEQAGGEPLLMLQGATPRNLLTDFGAITDHAAVRLVVAAGSAALDVPATDLLFRGEDSRNRTIYIPELHLSSGAIETFWVADNGGTYTASPGETEPVFSVLRREANVPWATPPDFKVDVFAKGFKLPVGISFLPNPGTDPDDPYFYVVELYGTIKVVRRNGAVSEYASGLLNYQPTGVFPGSGEQGVASAAVDPLNGDLYVTLVYRADPNVPNSPLYAAVDRFVSSDGGHTASSRIRVLDMAPESQGPAHQVANITFGPDGYLYVHTGDGLIPSTGQDLNQFRGKILRMTRAGAAVGRNPYYNARDGITARDYVYAYGLRNAWGGSWRLSEGVHYFVENGPSIDRFAKLVVGRNYGWDGTDKSMDIHALFNWNPPVSPTNVAFVERGLFDGSGFPVEYQGRAYVSQYCCGGGPGTPRGKAITEWNIDSEGNLRDGPRPVAIFNGSGESTPVTVTTGPDGLYFSDFAGAALDEMLEDGAKILRLQYQPEALPLDCNANGVADTDELATGENEDCNFNGIPDECDTATGREEDCDLNRVPDACQSSVPVSFDFTTGATGFVPFGSANAMSGAIRLTPAAPGSRGSAVHPGLSELPFGYLRAQFDFRIGGGSGADGLSFTAFDAARYPATVVFGENGPGSDALTIKLNTFNNGDGLNNIVVLLDGQPLGSYSPSCTLRDDETHTLQMHFDGERINVRVSCEPGVFETAFQGLQLTGFQPFVARLGFGARTGSRDDEHWIDSVIVWMPGETDLDGSGRLDSCESLSGGR